MPSNIKLITWHVYLVKVPYYDNNTGTYVFKARPCILYQNAGDDIVVLQITSNQNPDGTKKKNGNIFQVEVKFQRHGLVKVNQPITVSKNAITSHKSFGFKVPMNIRRKIIKTWGKHMVWAITK